MLNLCRDWAKCKIAQLIIADRMTRCYNPGI